MKILTPEEIVAILADYNVHISLEEAGKILQLMTKFVSILINENGRQ